MSLTSETLRIRNRKIEIEKVLRQLDHTIQIFSRSRVYVKNDEWIISDILPHRPVPTCSCPCNVYIAVALTENLSL